MIGSLRQQLQGRLDELAGEADRLRRALVALDPRSRPPPTRKPPARKATARTTAARRTPADTVNASSRPTAKAAKRKARTQATQRAPARRARKPAADSSRPAAPGVTKTAVLAALDGGEPLTAGEVAEKTGLGRPTISTTLSRLAKSGEVQKAKRGYSRVADSQPSLAE